MSDNKFGFTVDDIIAEFDKKKADPSAPYNITEDYDEEFSEELSPNGEYVPRHAKPAPPEEESEQNGDIPDSSDTSAEISTPEADAKQENAPTVASAEPSAAEQDKSVEPKATIEPKAAIEPKATVEPKTSYESKTAEEPKSEESTALPELDNSAVQETAHLDEPAIIPPKESEVPQTIENTKSNITESNIADDISEEETSEPSESEAPPQPAAVLDGVIPAESFSDKNTDESGTFSSVFANGLDDTDKAENEPQETVEVLNADIPDWGDILPEPSIEETVDDAITDYESEDIEEDETVPEDIDETDDTVDDISDDEIIDDEADPEKTDTPTEEENKPEKNGSSESETVQTDDIPAFNPEPVTLTAEEAAEDNAKKAKKNILKEILPWKGDTVFEMIRKIVFIIAVIIFIGAGVMLASTLIQSNKAVKDLEQIKEVVTTTAKTTIDSEGNVITVAPTEEEEQQHNIDIMSYYKGISDKVVGFIELEGCDIYQPVVQDPEDTTNTYYLTHTYYDEQNKGGAIFMDYRCTVSEDYVSPNLVLYGHNQEDGTMFGNLKNYKQDLEFYAANPTVTLRTEYETGIYLIYAYFVTNALEKQDSNGEVFHYHDYIEALNDEATFDWYMGEVQSRNQIISPVKAEFGDKLLVLSTCSNEFTNSRFVVFARKLRDGESVSDYDFTSASFNPYARGVDWTAIMSGETTTELTEETSEETTAPEETDEDGETTTKKKKKKKTSVSDEENSTDTLNASDSDTDTSADADVTTVPTDASDEGSEDTTTKKKKKKTTAESTEETSAEETTSKKKKSTDADTSEETTAEEITTKKKSKKTTTETTAEETTSKKKKKTKETTAETSDTEESTVTSIPETESEETTTVTAN